MMAMSRRWHVVIVLTAFLAGCVSLSEFNEGRSPSVTGKPSLIRAELRFGRNLDASNVRVVNVKSSKGDDVEILVGKNSRKARASACRCFYTTVVPVGALYIQSFPIFRKLKTYSNILR